MTSRVHGGNAPPGVLDFSAPVNPLGPPPQLEEALRECLKSKVYTRYPDYEYRRLREAIAEFAGAEPSTVVVLNGAAEALTLLPFALRARSLIVVEPCYGDHELLARRAGIELRRVLMRLDEGSGRVDVDVDEVIREVRRARRPALVLMSRPNNPTGHVVPFGQLVQILDRLPESCWLVVDEAFVDLCIDCKPVDADSNVIVIRSFTKALATPGMRLGYVLAHVQAAEALDALRQPWPVDALTACVFERLLSAYKDDLINYLRRSRQLVASELPRLAGGLRAVGLRVFESRAPYLLVRHHECPHPTFQQLLLKRGIYVRDASSFYGLDKTFSRVAVRAPRENDVLVRSVAEVLRSCAGSSR